VRVEAFGEPAIDRSKKIAGLLPLAALADFEAGKRVPYNRTLADICRALEDGGIKFIPENGGGAGARLKKRLPRPQRPTRSKTHHPRPSGSRRK